LFLPMTAPARADDLTRAAQEALRTRQLYYGEVDGIETAETTEAVRRFQEKKGFDPTGLLDETTLRALGLAPHAGPDAPGSERLEQSRDFILRYLHACQGGDLGAELAFYVGHVDYMGEGAEDKAGVEAELAAYRRNWPERRFKLLDCVASPNPANPDEIIATFRYRYNVRGDGSEREGIEDLNLILRSIGRELKIISIRAFNPSISSPTR
jgi:hypothetical protein